VGADGRRPWRVYARPFDARDERPRIAIIVTGLGLSQAATEAAITRLPGSVTLAFNPYAKGLDDWIPLAREAGHEVLLSLPMESANFPVHDPGPYALRTSLAPADNLRRLEFVLSRLSGYVGVVTLMGSGFTTAEEQLRPLLEALRGRGLLFVEAVRAPKTLAPEMAAEIDLPHVANDLVLDENPSRAAIDIRLAELEGIVRKRTTAVAMAAPNPATLERIAAWAATLEGKNLALAPVSAVALRQRTR
ncbi:MAG: divergent polysaccharide deacetylase family protein, partial [Proteobacteria bacterium]|nr:divergent polysaccharide deacetylase family protein [Pseudomonadota bacterium]